MDKITLANDVLFMCFTLLRLFHTFVLTSFLWSTLFPTVVFANKYARTPSDSIALKKYKRREYAQFNIGMHVLDPSEYDQTLHSPPSHTLSIPLGLSLEKTQRALDKLSFDSIYQRLSLVKDGFSWTALGLDFYLHYSGDLIVSRQELSDETRVIPTHFFLSNPHGALIFDDTLSFDKLILSGKDIVQKGDLSVNTLVLSNDGTFINENRVTTRQLILAPSTHTGANLTFINEGTFIGQKGSVIQGKGIFHNTPTGKVKTYQSLLLTQAEHLMLLNEGTFIAGGAIQGAFKGLINHGLFRAKQGFSDLTIHHFFNDTTGTIKGNGHRKRH